MESDFQPFSARLEEGAAPLISLRGVAKKYRIGETVVAALDHVDLDVSGGEFVVVLGPSGCGKTTLLNVIGGLDSPSEGTVVVAGVDVSAAPAKKLAGYRRRTVSFVFQSFNLFPGLTATENVQFAADVAERSNPRQVALEALKAVGLEDRAAHFPQQLSGGEQQRVAIARALASGNPVLLADEPTGELDFATGIQILSLLKDQADQGTTVFVVTHNREIARIADRVIELSGGHVVGIHRPEDPLAPDDLRW
ncbi:MAG: ABC transporter ATP-binding protein [Acidimicrobiales bacterium]|nr:ABC transporter ATP-binding protein [Acidimicrobiales bacterium]